MSSISVDGQHYFIVGIACLHVLIAKTVKEEVKYFEQNSLLRAVMFVQSTTYSSDCSILTKLRRKILILIF